MMKCSKIAALPLWLILVTACTVTPEQYKSGAQSGVGHSTAAVENIVNAKAQTVATASIGVPQAYVDPKLGTSTELLVQSEYFSANGRTCRRYSETVNGRSVSGVSCQDKTQGWIDIPLSSFVR